MSESDQMQVHKIMDGNVQLFQRRQTKNWYARFSAQGKQRKSSTKTSDLKQAKAAAKKLYLEALAGNHPTQTKFKTAVESYIKQYERLVAFGEKKAEDLEFNVRGKAKRFFIPYFGHMPIRSIKTRDIEKYKDWRISYWETGPGSEDTSFKRKTKFGPPKAATLNRELGVLNRIFKHAVKEQWIDEYDLPRIVGVRGKHSRRPTVEPFEMSKLLKHLDDRVFELGIEEQERRQRIVFMAFVNIAAYTGMRPVELDNLCWRDILGFKDDETFPFSELSELTVGEQDVRINVRGKNKQRRIIPLKSVTAVLSTLYTLWEHEQGKPPSPADPVLFNKDGSRQNKPIKRLREALDKLGISKDQDGQQRSFLSFRHFYATQLLSRGNSFHDVAGNMGTGIRMIEKHYYHANLERQAKKLQLEDS